MSTLKANVIDSSGSTTEFKDIITANGDKQWLDTYGIIKTNRETIGENITVPLGTNGFSTGEVTVNAGFTVTVNGEWTII